MNGVFFLLSIRHLPYDKPKINNTYFLDLINFFLV